MQDFIIYAVRMRTTSSFVTVIRRVYNFIMATKSSKFYVAFIKTKFLTACLIFFLNMFIFKLLNNFPLISDNTFKYTRL